MNRPLKNFTYIALAAMIISSWFLQFPARAQLSQANQPKLVLLLVIDQFGIDYLSRYQDKLNAGGFRYLTENGAQFLNCRFKQATAGTAVGHSVIAAGSYPWSTGVVANEWYDRRRDKNINACTDDAVQLIGGNGSGASCKSMLGTTIGDQMKLATNGKSKIFALSLKDRASLFMGGRLANGAYWWDTRTGNFVTSSQFGSTLPGWLKAFNDTHYADKFFGKAWQRSLQETQYTASTRDDYTYERAFPGDGKQFPHIINGGLTTPGEAFYETFAATPWANQMLFDLAKETVTKENIGGHQDCDLLSISFSAPDYLGHSFGPYSQEMQDMCLQMDQSLAEFLQFIDKKVGLNKCLIVLTADHGCMPIPEFLREKGMEAGRVDPKAFKSLLDASMDQKLGADDWITAFEPPNLYLNLDTIDKQKYRQPDVESLAAKLAHSIPGIGEVFTAYQFFMNELPSSPVADAARKSYYWGRSGELYVMTRPGFIFSSASNGTTHGSPYAYDTHVPLILCGPQIRAGRFGTDCSPADIAPTITAILGIGAPSLCEGKALAESMMQVQGPPQALTVHAVDTGTTQK